MEKVKAAKLRAIPEKTLIEPGHKKEQKINFDLSMKLTVKMIWSVELGNDNLLTLIKTYLILSRGCPFILILVMIAGKHKEAVDFRVILTLVLRQILFFTQPLYQISNAAFKGFIKVNPNIPGMG